MCLCLHFSMFSAAMCTKRRNCPAKTEPQIPHTRTSHHLETPSTPAPPKHARIAMATAEGRGGGAATERPHTKPRAQAPAMRAHYLLLMGLI